MFYKDRPNDTSGTAVRSQVRYKTSYLFKLISQASLVLRRSDHGSAVRKSVLVLVALLAGGATAFPAYRHHSPASTSITCPLAASFTAPLAVGATICTIAVSPSNWTGTLALSGPGANNFAVSGRTLIVYPAVLNAGTYSVTITGTP